eukprot:TRINITY_DN9128_c0_g1_i1.p1 TRINITY_DN9128_c0_g1~~TRINITY_DN9128_c0_g1_i1.p1  ORF type:complete len:395 (+),score=67.29 TRINITY_DN9128_c0_g1_i1:149-1333(+)
MEHLARKLGMEPSILKQMNFYQPGDKSVVGMPFDKGMHLASAWLDARNQSEYDRRLKEANAFNSAHSLKRRGISIVPVKYYISPKAFNFASKAQAMVSILGDGSVIVRHGGVEMGQGLHTKMIQVAADALGIPFGKIRVANTTQEVLPHCGGTGGSTGTELNCGAVVAACDQLVARLAPIKKQLGEDAPWEKICGTASMMRVNMSALGQSVPQFDTIFKYTTWGVAFCEAEVDLLTGNSVVRRVDIIQDVGKSLNPGVDIGQCEGAFVQMTGWLTTEQLVWDAKGKLMCGSYEVPSVTSVPKELNVTFVPNSVNEATPRGAKGIGEPPACMSVAVLAAIRNSVLWGRDPASVPDKATFEFPLTPERIRALYTDVVLEEKALQEEAEEQEEGIEH